MARRCATRMLWFALLLAFGLAGLALWGTWWAIIPFAIYGHALSPPRPTRAGTKPATAPRSRPTG